MATKYIHYAVDNLRRRTVKKALEDQGNFKIELDGTGLNLALEENYHKARPKYFKLRKLLNVDGSSSDSIQLFSKAILKESEAMAIAGEQHVAYKTDIKEMIAKCDGGREKAYHYWRALDKVLWFSKPEELCELLFNDLIPKIQAVFPRLSVYWVSMDSRLAQRESIIRCLFAESKIPQIINPNAFPGCQTLRDLHVQSLTGFDSYLRFGVNTFSPYICGHVSTRYYNGLVLLFGEPFDARSNMPGINMDSFSPKSTFMMEQRAVLDNDERFVLDKRLSAVDYICFLEWYVEKLNEFVFYLSDPTHYPDKNKTSELSPERWLMTSLTIVRILHETQTTQVNINRNDFIRKILAFASLDKISTLCSLRCNGRLSDVDVFKYLLSKNKSSKTLKRILSEVPQPYSTVLQEKCDLIYNEIEKTVLDGIFVKGFRQGDRIEGIIGGKAYNQNTDDYIGSYLRTIRNTHHGYLSEKKSYFCPPELAINTGNLSDLFPELTALWVLALILNPKRFI